MWRARGEDPTGGFWGQGTRGERTPNIQPMVVTLDVSKLTGWLKAAAFCRFRKQRAYDEGRGA